MEMTNNDWKKKLTSPEEAVKLVHDHDRIFIGFVSNITPVLSDALWERYHHHQRTSAKADTALHRTYRKSAI